MKYDAVRWLQTGRIIKEVPTTVEAPNATTALDELRTADVGTVQLIIVRRHRRRGPWALWARDYSLPVPDHGAWTDFGLVTLQSEEFGFADDRESPIVMALPAAARTALRPLWSRLLRLREDLNG